jgi:hypothetical protein
MSDPGRIPFLRAVKHGAFAKTAILPGEDRQEFEELHSALIEEWAPVGPTEEDAVLSIAKGVWRKRRLQKFLHAEMEMCRSDREHPLYDEAQAVRTLLNTLETRPFLKLMEPVPDHFEPFAPEHIETAIRLISKVLLLTSPSSWNECARESNLNPLLTGLRCCVRSLRLYCGCLRTAAKSPTYY